MSNPSRNSISILFLVILIPIFGNLVFGQNYLDAGFSHPTLESPGTLTAVAVQTDGKILIGSRFTKVNGIETDSLVRLNPDGSLDGSFANAATGVGIGSTVNSIAIQPDGKILVAGLLSGSSGTRFLTRLNPDGTPDDSFNAAVNPNSSINEVAVQADGRIVIAGNFTQVNGTPRARIARLDSNGALDPTFGVGTGFNTGPSSLMIQSDGRMILGGLFSTYNGIVANRLVRLNADGTHDPTFNVGTGTNSIVDGIAEQSDGKIIIVGGFTMINGTARDRIARLNPNGSLDAGFTPSPLFSSAIDLAIQPDGKIVIGGGFPQQVKRLNPDGSDDPTFNAGSGGSGGVVVKTRVLADGKLLLAGTFTAFGGSDQSGIVRLNPDGSIDPAMAADLLTQGNVNAIATQPDEKILIGGDFTFVNGVARSRIARLNADGTLDASFDPGTGANASVNSIAIQSDGKILAAGNFGQFNGSERWFLARLNPDGNLDNSFVPAYRATPLNRVATVPDGKILTAGFVYFDGVVKGALTRLDTDGSLDAAFNANINSTVNALALQSDGKIVIGGAFTSVSGISRNRIARLNSDGSLDTDFNPGTGFNSTVLSVALSPDGDIVAGGAFTSYNGTTGRGGIVRLDPTGPIDGAWTSAGGTNSQVRTVNLLPTGKILIGGVFSSVNQSPYSNLARLLPNGATDTVFPNLNINGVVITNTVQADGKILLGGSFNSVDGVRKPTLARLSNYVFTLEPGLIEFGQTATGRIEMNLPAPAGGAVFNITSSDPLAAGVPASITIPEGETFGTFPITTPNVVVDEVVDICVGFLGNSQSRPIRVIDESLQFYLDFENDLLDADGDVPTIASGVTFEPGINGIGGRFSNAQLFYPSLNNIDSREGTLEFWIKPRWAGNDGIHHTILQWGFGGGMIVIKDGANNLRLYLNRFVAEKNIGIQVGHWQPNEWHHVVFSWSNSQKRLRGFIDGVEYPSDSISGDFPAISATDFQIGNGFALEDVDAILDELKISRIPHVPESTGDVAVTLDRTQTGGGTSVTGTISISAPAPSGGARVFINSDNPGVATVPVSVLIPKGQISAPFTLTTAPVVSDTPITISASYFGRTAGSSLTVLTPKSISGKIVRSTDGSPINKVIVVVKAADGSFAQTVLTDPLGNFEVIGLVAGKTYTIRPELKKFTFAPATRSVMLVTDTTGLDFVGSK